MLVTVTNLAVRFPTVERAAVRLLLSVRSKMVEKFVKVWKNKIAVWHLTMEKFDVKTMSLLEMVHRIVCTWWNVSFKTYLFMIKIFSLDHLDFHVWLYLIFLFHFDNKFFVKNICYGMKAFVIRALYLLNDFRRLISIDNTMLD